MKFLLLSFTVPILLIAKVDFVHQVMPILKKNCAECHTDGKKKGGLSMNTRSEFLAGGEGEKLQCPETRMTVGLLNLPLQQIWMSECLPKVPGFPKMKLKFYANGLTKE